MDSKDNKLPFEDLSDFNFSLEIFKKNPNAAIVNPMLVKQNKETNKEKRT